MCVWLVKLSGKTKKIISVVKEENGKSLFLHYPKMNTKVTQKILVLVAISDFYENDINHFL